MQLAANYYITISTYCISYPGGRGGRGGFNREEHGGYDRGGYQDGGGRGGGGRGGYSRDGGGWSGGGGGGREDRGSYTGRTRQDSGGKPYPEMREPSPGKEEPDIPLDRE